ncbi:MAG: N-acetyltransferase [Planctomycetales bacterium]|nr:N-acetyltransferase [Planctomycetales bacterium]
MPKFFAHPNALVETDQLGEGTRVWAFAHVLSGAKIGDNCNIGDHAFVEGGAVIGNNVTVKNNVCVWDGVRLEDDTFIGPNVAFTNDRYARSPRMETVRTRYEKADNWLERTIVCRGATLGANSTIMPGLTLGEFSFVAAGSVVTKDVSPYVLVAGNPAHPIGSVCECGKRTQSPGDRCTDCD